MRASELIKWLQEATELHGDLPVFVYDDIEGEEVEEIGIYVKTSEQKRIVIGSGE